MIKIVNESYNAAKAKNLVLKSLIKHYLPSNGGYGISKAEQTEFAKEDALKHIDTAGYTDADFEELAEFLNSLTFPITVYRGLSNKDRSTIKTGINSGVHWTIDPEYIKNQTNLLKFTYVMIGTFDEKDVDLPKTAETYLGYSMKDQKKRYNKHREMEIWVKQRKEPKNLEIITFDEFCERY